MTLKQVWKQTNISTLLILPLFDHIVAGAQTRLKPNISFPLLLIAYEYDLINAYLFREENSSKKSLHVVFGPKINQDLGLTNSSYYSFGDRLINSKEFISVESVSDKVIYELRIPEEFYDDIDIITQGRYSKVSKEYKETIKIKQKFIPRWTAPLGYYICKENLPYSIVSKQRHLKEEMDSILQIDLSSKQEFYDKFSLEKEKYV